MLRLVLFLPLMLPQLSMGQQNLQITLLYGTYFTDYSHSKFRATEHVWKLNGEILLHKVNANSETWDDTLKLTTAELDSILVFCQSNNLCKEWVKKIESQPSTKYKLSEVIQGTIRLNNRTYSIDLRAENYNVMDEDPVGSNFKKLKAIFSGYLTRRNEEEAPR